MEIKFKNETLAEVVKIAKENGLKVYQSVYESQKDNPLYEISYVHITDGTNICYCQASDYFGAVDFGTVHVPNKQTGSGFGMFSSEHYPDLSHINYAMKRYPIWASSADIQHSKSYGSWANFEKSEAKFKSFQEL